MMTSSEKLAFRKSISSGRLAKLLDKLWYSKEVTRLFPEYLILLQQIIRASVPLMEAARQETLKLDRSDPLRMPLADYLAGHIEEEQQHDEWTLTDLSSIGLDRDAVLGRIPMPNTAALVGAQYYWIYHHHPVGLLGYISVLEGDPGEKHVFDELQERSGLPESLFRTYRLHGELDAQHIEELDRFIDSLPLTEAQFSLMAVSAITTNLRLADCVATLLSDSECQSPAHN